MKTPIFIAGPCVIESEGMVLKTAERLKEISERLEIDIVFKSSYDKANKTSVKGFRGPGIERGLEILRKVKDETGLRVLTDVHDLHDIKRVAEVVDVIQIPAFLSRQTDMLIEAGKTGKVVNIKKGQFMSPNEIIKAAEKVFSTGNQNVWITERGTFFGYNDLVVDFRNLVWIKKAGIMVIYDATHSLQRPGLSENSGGYRELISHLARGAVAVGVDGIFAEVHPNPREALSDASTQIPLNMFEDFVKMLLDIWNTSKNWYHFEFPT
ncbi:MAG: 3-deoxy-8-phosphooctulonate synthase [candidate division WOR-3 bacterium]